MRIKSTLWFIPWLAVAACSQAGATTVDPTNDFHCGVTAEYYFELAKVFERPEKEQRATYLLSQWYLVNWDRDHPGVPADRKGLAQAIATTIEANQKGHLGVLSECMDRAADDPKFSQFVDIMNQRR